MTVCLKETLLREDLVNIICPANPGPLVSTCQHLGASFTSKQLMKWGLQNPRTLGEGAPSSLESAEFIFHPAWVTSAGTWQRCSISQRDHAMKGQNNKNTTSVLPKIQPITGRTSFKARKIRIMKWSQKLWELQGSQSLSNPNVVLHMAKFLLPMTWWIYIQPLDPSLDLATSL